MLIGVPKEVKTNESRVALTPAGAAEFVARGHQVLVQRHAGQGSGITDEEYQAAGAVIGEGAASIWEQADMILKVKEPEPGEYSLLRQDQILFTYLHLAASRPCTEALVRAGTTAIAYETVRSSSGQLPLLAPMSEVAGRLAAQIGSYQLMQPAGGSGILMGGVPGTAPAKVVVIGGGTAGEEAAATALGLRADVTVIDINLDRLRDIDRTYGGQIRTLASNALTISEQVAAADLVIGSVLIPGAAAPKLVTKDMVSRMRPGSVLVDIAIDQGGCFEGSRPTTHADPTFKVHDAVYYCVANMPGAVPRTSTYALTNATLPYALQLAGKGWKRALLEDPYLAGGLNVHGGRIVHPQVAAAHGMSFSSLQNVLSA